MSQTRAQSKSGIVISKGITLERTRGNPVQKGLTRTLDPEPSPCKLQPIDWDGWAEERRKYGAYKDTYNPCCVKKNRRQLTHNGKTQTPKQWCKELGLTIKPETLWLRIAKYGWSFDKAIAAPSKRLSISYQGKSQSLIAWSRELNISISTLQYRLLKLKLPIEVAFSPPYGFRKLLLTWRNETKTLQE